MKFNSFPNSFQSQHHQDFGSCLRSVMKRGSGPRQKCKIRIRNPELKKDGKKVANGWHTNGKRIAEGKARYFILLRSFCNPFAIRLLSVCNPFAILGRKDSSKDNFDEIGLSMACVEKHSFQKQLYCPYIQLLCLLVTVLIAFSFLNQSDIRISETFIAQNTAVCLGM